jgi:hypothetical protein
MRQADLGAEPATGPVRQNKLATMGEHDRPGDRKAEANPSGVAASRRFEPDERLKHVFKILLGYPGSIIVDHNDRSTRRVVERHPGALAILHRVGDEIDERALERGRPASIGQAIGLGEGDVLAHVGLVVDHGRDQRSEIDRARGLRRRIVPGEGERGLDHPLHVLERHQHLRPRVLVLEQFRPKLERGDRRTEVMPDRRDHPRTVGDEAAQPLLHPVEGDGDAPDLVGSFLGHRRLGGSPPERVRPGGERPERTRRPVGRERDDEEDRDHHHDRRRGGGPGPVHWLGLDLRLGV